MRRHRQFLGDWRALVGNNDEDQNSSTPTSALAAQAEESRNHDSVTSRPLWAPLSDAHDLQEDLIDLDGSSTSFSFQVSTRDPKMTKLPENTLHPSSRRNMAVGEVVLTLRQGNRSPYALVASSATESRSGDQPATQSSIRSPTTTPRKRKARAPLSGLPSPDAQEGVPALQAQPKSSSGKGRSARPDPDAFFSVVEPQDVASEMSLDQIKAAAAIESKHLRSRYALDLVSDGRANSRSCSAQISKVAAPES